MKNDATDTRPRVAFARRGVLPVRDVFNFSASGAGALELCALCPLLAVLAVLMRNAPKDDASVDSPGGGDVARTAGFEAGGAPANAASSPRPSLGEPIN